MSLEDSRIGFLGAGAMAEALAGGLLAAGVDAQRIAASDPDPVRRERFERQLGVHSCDDNGAIVRESDAVVLAVKPGVVLPLLEALRSEPELDLARPLWISIAAGLPLWRLESGLGSSARIVRAMPNTPALVRAGATAICGNPRAGSEELAVARRLFDSVGFTWEAPREELLDAVTGLSGSGPAYVFLLLEALGESGEGQGLPRAAARRLAAQTVFGAAKLALESEHEPAELRARVTSPGGTTLAGLQRLEAGGFRQAVRDAVAAAAARSRELGQE